MEKPISIQIEFARETLEVVPRAEHERFIREATVVELYRSSHGSQLSCSKELGIERLEFIDMLSNRRVAHPLNDSDLVNGYTVLKEIYGIKGCIVLDTDVTSDLIRAGKIDVLNGLFNRILMPQAVLSELHKSGGREIREFVRKLPAWIIRHDAEKEFEMDGTTLSWVHPGSAAAVSLAVEETMANGSYAAVLSNDHFVDHCCRVARKEDTSRKCFTADFWSLVCRASACGRIDLEKERADLEAICPIGDSKENREFLREFGSFSRKQKVDMFQAYQREVELLNQSRDLRSSLENDP